MRLSRDEKIAIIRAKEFNGRVPMATSFVIKTKNSYRITQKLNKGEEYLFKVWYDGGNYVETGGGKEIEKPKRRKTTSKLSDASDAKTD